MPMKKSVFTLLYARLGAGQKCDVELRLVVAGTSNYESDGTGCDKQAFQDRYLYPSRR